MVKFEIIVKDDYKVNIGEVSYEQTKAFTEEQAGFFAVALATMCCEKIKGTFEALSAKDSEGIKDFDDACKIVKECS